MKPKLLRITAQPVSLYKLLKGQLSFLSQYFEVIGICSKGRYFEQLREQENINLIDVDIHRNISLWSDIKALFKLIVIFRREKPLIVHSHTPKAGLLSMVAGKISKVPIRIHTYTGLRFETAKGVLRIILMMMDRITCFCATNIIPEGDGVKKILYENHITKKKMHKIYNGNINGIDIDYFNPSQVSQKEKSVLCSQYNILPTDFVLCFIGRLVSDKGINELVKTFCVLNKKYDNLKLLLVGPEEKEDPLLKETQNIININPNIIAVGLQQDVRPFLAISNLFVFPSKREGFPNVLLQAGAMNCPCVVSNISGNNEIIIDGYNGVIVNSIDVESFSNAIESLYLDRGKLKSIAENARSSIVSRFKCEDVWEALLNEYNKIISDYGKCQVEKLR